MQEIRLQLKRSGVVNVILGLLIVVSGAWLAIFLVDSISTGLLLGLCVSLWGLAFIIIGVKLIRAKPHPISFAGNKLTMPRKTASREIVEFNPDEIIEYGIKSYLLPYIKTFEIRSSTDTASILLDSFENKKDIAKLSNFLRNS